MENLKILIVEDEPGTRMVLERMLQTAGHDVLTAENGEQAMAMVEQGFFHVILTDVSMPGETDGLGVLEQVKGRFEQTEVVLMTAYANVETAVEAMKKGAADYLQKPVDFDELKMRLEKIATLKAAVSDISNLREAMAVTEKNASQTIQDLEMYVVDLEGRCRELQAILSDEGLDFDERVTLSLERLAAWQE